MKDFLKKNTVTVLVLLATLILAGVAVFTAVRLYQLRNQSVAPNVPSSKPAAAEPACTLNFTLETTTTETITCAENLTDDFGGTTIDTTKWSKTNGVAVVNNEIQISKPANTETYQRLRTIKKVTGDFQAEVDITEFTTQTGNSTNYATAELMGVVDNDNYFTVRWYKNDTKSQMHVWIENNNQVTQGTFIDIPSNSTPHIKLVRQGSTIKGYVTTGNETRELPTLSTAGTTQPVDINLFSYGRGPQSAQVSFDNFSLSCIEPEKPTIVASCESGKPIATVTWPSSPTSSNGYYVDISETSTFPSSQSWHKLISDPETISTKVPTGFTKSTGSEVMPDLAPNKTYYVRIVYRQPATLSETVSFTTTACSTISCNNSCSQDSDCLYGLVCSSNVCRNNGCKDRTDCNCNTGGSPTPTPTPTGNGTPRPTATPTVRPSVTPTPTAPGATPTSQPELPDAGVSTPTLIGGVAGVLLLLGAMLLAL